MPLIYKQDRCEHSNTITRHPNCFDEKGKPICPYKYREERCLHRCSIADHPNCFTKDGRLKQTEFWWKKKKIGFLDIESSNLDANFGINHCWVIKEYGKKSYCSGNTGGNTYKQRLDGEKKSLQKLCKDLKKFDIIVTFYGARFDIPFLRSRCLWYNIEFPIDLEVYHHDLYFDVRRKLKLHSNRLAVVSKFLGVKEQKTALEGELWVKAMMGDPKSRKYIYEHCVRDVDVLEFCFVKMLPYIRLNRTTI
jgi:uncharacterized protein YprB with RNaseH-like and TPR domain